MGEIADMILDGILCQSCAEFIGDEVGHPRYCSGCNAAAQAWVAAPKVRCSVCKRKVKEVGLKDHMRDAHGVSQP